MRWLVGGVVRGCVTVAFGCGVNGEVEGESSADPGSDSSGSDSSGSSSGGNEEEEDGEFSGTAEWPEDPDACAPSAGQTCGPMPIDCSEENCGSPFSLYGPDGCPWPECVDGACAEGETCFSAWEYGGCIYLVDCYEADGACECSPNNGCGGSSACVPAELVPSQRCADITDAAACVAAGCTAIETVRAIDDACGCGEPEPLCVWAPGELTGSDEPMVYWRETDNEALVFSRTFDTAPYGWLGCNESGNHEACDCIGARGDDPCAL